MYFCGRTVNLFDLRSMGCICKSSRDHHLLSSYSCSPPCCYMPASKMLQKELRPVCIHVSLDFMSVIIIQLSLLKQITDTDYVMMCNNGAKLIWLIVHNNYFILDWVNWPITSSHEIDTVWILYFGSIILYFCITLLIFHTCLFEKMFFSFFQMWCTVDSEELQVSTAWLLVD